MTLSLALPLSGGLRAPLGGGLAHAAAKPATPPQAEPSQAEQEAAANHYQSGVTFFQAGNYSAARAEFEAAYQLTRYPDLLYNLAKVAQQQNRTDEEARYLQEYLDTNPKDSTEVRNRLEHIRQPPPPERIPPTGSLVLVGSGLGALIIGIGCGGAAIAAAHQVADPANAGKPFSASLLSTQQSGIQLSRAAIAFDVLGGAALAAGGAWIGYWLYKKQHDKRPAPLPKTALLPSGLGLTLIGSY